jgi:hypothetical protein
MNSATDVQNRKGDRQPKCSTLWSRLRGALLSADRGAETECDHRDPLSVVTEPALVAEQSGEAGDDGEVIARPQEEGSTAPSGVLLPFPVHGEALLVKLAEVLRNRIADRALEWDPLLLQMSRCPQSRLSIDHRAYIEFDQDRCEYRAVIEASQETKVILETVDFDALVDFVLPYIAARLSRPAALEAAS